MAVIKREDLRAMLKRRELAPVYVLFGSETYLRDIAARTIAEFCFSPDDFRDFNESSFSLNADGSLQAALGAANQLPMMAARRLVRITDVRISASGHLDTITEAHEKILSEYLRDPSPTSVVVFIADELNGVRKMGKLLRNETAAVEFEPLTDDELFIWARKKFVDDGFEIEMAAMRRLVALVGRDVARLENEISKVCTATLPQRNVTLDMIESLVPDSREMTNFELTDSLVDKNVGKTMRVLKKILDDGAEPLMLLGLISYNFRRLLIAKEMMSSGADRGDIGRAVKLRYSDLESFLAAARRSDSAALSRMIERIAKTDRDIKMSVGRSGPSGARMQLEVLVCELATI